MAQDGLQHCIVLVLSGLQDDVGLHLLPAHIVGDRHHGGVHHRLQVLQHRLDLARGDILAGAAHHVLQTADDVEIAALVLAEEIAGTEPLAEIGVAIGFRLLVVALHQPLAAHHQLADLALRHIRAILIDDPAFAERRRLAAGTGADHFRRLQRHKQRRPDLGHAEGLHRRRIEALAQIGVDFLAHTIDVGAAQADIGVARAWRLLIDHFRKQAEMDAVFGEPSGEAAGALPVGDIERAALVEGQQQQPLRVEIEERRGGQNAFQPLAVAQPVHLASAQPVPVAQHAALGEACGTGGVLDVQQIVMAGRVVQRQHWGMAGGDLLPAPVGAGILRPQQRNAPGRQGEHLLFAVEVGRQQIPVVGVEDQKFRL